jgi:hypothetical protein
MLRLCRRNSLSTEADENKKRGTVQGKFVFSVGYFTTYATAIRFKILP